MKGSGYWDNYILNGNLFSTIQYNILSLFRHNRHRIHYQNGHVFSSINLPTLILPRP